MLHWTTIGGGLVHSLTSLTHTIVCGKEFNVFVSRSRRDVHLQEFKPIHYFEAFGPKKRRLSREILCSRSLFFARKISSLLSNAEYLRGLTKLLCCGRSKPLLVTEKFAIMKSNILVVVFAASLHR